MANATDITKYSYAELLALINTAQTALESKREEELKVLADGFAKKLQAASFSIDEGIEALQPYRAAKAKRAARGTATASRGEKAYIAGTVYRNPAGPESWTGGTKGQLPAWLKAHVGDAQGDAKAAKFAELAKK